MFNKPEIFNITDGVYPTEIAMLDCSSSPQRQAGLLDKLDGNESRSGMSKMRRRSL
jgi:hypothetical protein